MKSPTLRLLLMSAAIVVQVNSWKTTSVNLDFSRRPVRSLYPKTGLTERIQSFLTPSRRNHRSQNVRQRNIRDLMTNMNINPRAHMMSSPSFQQNAMRQMMASPLSDLGPRGSNRNLQYQEAFSMPSNSGLHAMREGQRGGHTMIEDPRGHRMVAHKQNLRNSNHQLPVRSQPVHQRSPPRSTGMRKQPNMSHALKDYHGILVPPGVHPSRQRNPVQLEPALSDILSSSASSNSRLRSQNTHNKVEVIHHIPFNPSGTKSSPAVVYISNQPKNTMQVPQGMYSRNPGQMKTLGAEQSKIIPNHPFMVGEHGMDIPRIPNFKQDNNVPKRGFQNPRFVTQPNIVQQNVQQPYVAPGSGGINLQDRFKQKSFKNTPRPQVMREIPPNTRNKQLHPQYFATSAGSTHENGPRINRLKAELNAEIKELLKHVPHSPPSVTSKPRLNIQPQIPNPFLIPASHYENKFENNNNIKSTMHHEVPVKMHYEQMPTQHKPNLASHLSTVQADKQDMSMKTHPLNSVPHPVVTKVLNQRRPIVSEQEVDSEELAEILKSINYQGDGKVVHNGPGVNPLKYIISDEESEETQPIDHVPLSVSGERLHMNSDATIDDIIDDEEEHMPDKDVVHSINSTTEKKYSDFPEQNENLEIPPPHITEIDSEETTVDKSLKLNQSVGNYQGQESIASISIKEEFPIEEDFKNKFHHTKQNPKKLTSGTLHEIYNKQIFKEGDSVSPSHFVPYFPKRLVQPVVETASLPSSENQDIYFKTTTEPYGTEVVTTVTESATAPTKAITYSENIPKETIESNIPQSNSKDDPPYSKTTKIPNYFGINNRNIPQPNSKDDSPYVKTTKIPNYFATNNKNVYFDQYYNSTPNYFITKTTTHRPYGRRKWIKNENVLVQKYVVPELQIDYTSLKPPNYPSEYDASEINQTNDTNSFVYQNFVPVLTTESVLNTDEPIIGNVQKQDDINSKKPVVYDNAETTEHQIETIQTNLGDETNEHSDENYSETENPPNSNEVLEFPETATLGNRQFFRGPQHSISFEEFSTHISLDSTSNLTPHTSIETTMSPTIVTDFPKTEPITQLNEPNANQHSVHSQTKVINALQLAHRVFGRKNHTSSKQVFTTTKMPQFKHKFTYAPVVTPSTKTVFEPESINSGRRVVFNFRTGTTHSISQITSSAIPKVIYNAANRNKFGSKSKNYTLELITDLKEDDQVITSSSPKSVFRHVVFSQPSINVNANQSIVTESSKNLYGILKPITKPYNASMTPFLKKELKKIPLNVFKALTSSTTIHSLSSTTFSTEEPATSDSTTEQASSAAIHETDASNNIDSTSTSPTTTYSEKNISLQNIFNETDESTESLSDTNLPDIQSEASVIIEERKPRPSTTTETPSDTKIIDTIDQEQAVVDSLKLMKLKMQEMASKGLRHLMPLVMELSSDVSISSDCTFSLLRWLRAVRTMEQWAVRMMDASSKIPEGILYGTFSTFGSYDQCVGIKTPKANLQIPYSGQYCSVNLQPILPPSDRHFTIQNAFHKYPKLKQVFQEMNIEEDTMAYYYILKHRIGLCMPSTCTMEDLGNVTEKLADQLKMKISVERCETADKPKLTRGQIISMSCVFVAFGIVVLATVIDISMRFRSGREMDIDEIIRKKNGIRHFSFVFSAYGNACKILDTSIPVTHMSSLHGIKFLSITWVMLGHVYYCKDYLTLAGLNKVRDLGSNFAFQVVLNSAFAADTFFFLSGLLVVYSTFIYLENHNGRFTIVGFYLRRYCRLTPAFLMISGVILLGPLAGSGPIWHETLEPFVSGCQNYWWTNLFYFSNFMPTAKTCVPHGWFLSCDMQFYIVAPIIILALYRRPKLGILLIILGILSSMITTGFLTFLYNLPPVSLFSLPDPKDINEYLDTIGYRPYAHYASYCVGMATGFLLAAKQKISISKCVQIFGWSASTLGCCLVIYGTWNWNSGELPDWPVSVAYATTSRTVWSLGVAWLTVVCYAGHGGLINSILSWHGFIPLSRLSYLAYLIHPLLMYLYASYVRAPFYFSQYVVVYLYLGHLCVTFGLAFIFSLAFELPFLNLEKVITKYLDRSKRKRRASFSNHHNNWQHPEHPELKDSVVLMRRRADKFLT